MFSAADLIDTVRKRARRSLRPERPPGEFPPGWAQWFDAMAQRIGRVRGATADAIVAVFLQRELAAPPPSVPALNRWQAFGTLWRQQWHPPEREDRRARIVALALTLLVHLVLFVALLWLADVRFMAPPPAAGEEIVQVEFVGRGTPRDTGGGPPNATPAPQHVSSAPAHPQAPSRAQPAPAATAQPQATAPAPHQQVSSAPPAEQPVQVSQSTASDAAFVLPPPTPPAVSMPQVRIAAPVVEAPMRAVELAPALPAIQSLPAKLPDMAVPAPRIPITPKQVALTATVPAESPPNVVQPLPAPGVKPAPPAPVVPQVATPASAATTLPAEAKPVATPVAPGASTPSTPAASAPAAPASGTQPSATQSGRGPTAAAKPGAFPTPMRGDDWGASTRNQPGGNPGGTPGLLNADGTPHMPPGTAAAGGGFPPGSDHWTRDQLDRAGTWLKRPPNDYSPTRFDQYWVPTGTLLEQWVRQGVRELSIPIPGTSKKIKCVISILQLGGGCGITDPNLQDQEATARPPPDIPFKPELQEDQGSLKKPQGP